MENLKLDPESLRSRAGSQSSSKANPATVSRGIQALFSAYRRDDFADPEGFVAQLGSILSEFPDDVVVFVTSPRTGLQRRSKWPPTISEVLTACEDHQEYLRKVREQKPIRNFALLSAPDTATRAQGSWANIFCPDTDPRYAKLCEAVKTEDPKFWIFGNGRDGRPGIHVSLTIWNGVQPMAASQQWRRWTDEELLARYPKAAPADEQVPFE